MSKGGRPPGRHCRDCRVLITEPLFCEVCDEEVTEYCMVCHDLRKHSFRRQDADPVQRGGKVVGRDAEDLDAEYNGSGIYD